MGVLHTLCPWCEEDTSELALGGKTFSNVVVWVLFLSRFKMMMATNLVGVLLLGCKWCSGIGCGWFEVWIALGMAVMVSMQVAVAVRRDLERLNFPVLLTWSWLILGVSLLFEAFACTAIPDLFTREHFLNRATLALLIPLANIPHLWDQHALVVFIATHFGVTMYIVGLDAPWLTLVLAVYAFQSTQLFMNNSVHSIACIADKELQESHCQISRQIQTLQEQDSAYTKLLACSFQGLVELVCTPDNDSIRRCFFDFNKYFPEFRRGTRFTDAFPKSEDKERLKCILMGRGTIDDVRVQEEISLDAPLSKGRSGILTASPGSGYDSDVEVIVVPRTGVDESSEEPLFHNERSLLLLGLRICGEMRPARESSARTLHGRSQESVSRLDTRLTNWSCNLRRLDENIEEIAEDAFEKEHSSRSKTSRTTSTRRAMIDFKCYAVD